MANVRRPTKKEAKALHEIDGMYYKLKHDVEGDCDACDLIRHPPNCDEMQRSCAATKMVDILCYEHVYKRVDPLYQDLLKLKELTDASTKSSND